MKNTFTCLFVIAFVFSGIYACNKSKPERSSAADKVQFSAVHGSLNLNPGGLHNKVVWTYMNNKPQEQTEFTKADVLQMTRDILAIMSDNGYYEGYINDVDMLSAEMLAGMEAMGYFNTAGTLKSAQELKELHLYPDDDNLLQKVINKINANPTSSVTEFIQSAKADMNTLSNTAYHNEALAFKSIIDSSAAFVPDFMIISLPTIFLPSASNLRIAYADAKGYTEGTKAAQNLGKNAVQQDIWGMTYSTTRSVQQFKRELGI